MTKETKKQAKPAAKKTVARKPFLDITAPARPARERAANAGKKSSQADMERMSKERVARAGMRSMDRREQNDVRFVEIRTLTGRALTKGSRERTTQNRLALNVDFIRTDDADKGYEGTKDPVTYPDMAKDMTPDAMSAVLGMARGKKLTAANRRAAATARAAGEVSEDQRNGGAKHARAAARVVAKGQLSAARVYSGNTPAFMQAKSKRKNVTGDIGGMEYHRRVMTGEEPMTADQRLVIDNMSASTTDGVKPYNNKDVIDRYNRRIARQQAQKAKKAPVPSAKAGKKK